MNKENITIYCKNIQQKIEVPIGSSLLDIYKLVGEPLPNKPMNAWVNNRSENLNYKIWKSKDVEFVDYSNLSGMRAYVRSLCFILAKSAYDICPQATLYLEHPVSKGYYCVIQNGESVTTKDIESIKNRMQELIDADLPFIHHYLRTNEVSSLFRKNGLEQNALLADSAGLLYTACYELDGYVDYFYGDLVPSTGYISLFDLIPYEDGLLLRIPQRKDPTLLEPVVPQQKMFKVYKEHLTLQRTIGLNNVAQLNKAIEAGKSQGIIQVSEAMQEKCIARIADEIAYRYKHDGVRIVMIAGPSSSGKTTFCKRLQIQLITNLLHPLAISLDNYFLNREDTPKDEFGDYDFESLYALDLPLFNNDLKKLLDGEEIEIPNYQFETGSRIYRGEKLKLKENSILVMEGIHGLNPELTQMIDNSAKYKIYVSALTSISLDNHNWIPTTDNRLIRRIIRDARSRGYSAKETIARWPSVRRGEDKWIFPYQENADAMFNSAMLYELAALRKYAEPLLFSVRENEQENVEAYRLLRFLRYFTPIPINELPRASLLREFLGGGSFTY